jgi:hypothetical protein
MQGVGFGECGGVDGWCAGLFSRGLAGSEGQGFEDKGHTGPGQTPPHVAYVLLHMYSKRVFRLASHCLPGPCASSTSSMQGGSTVRSLTCRACT